MLKHVRCKKRSWCNDTEQSFRGVNDDCVPADPHGSVTSTAIRPLRGFRCQQYVPTDSPAQNLPLENCPSPRALRGRQSAPLCVVRVVLAVPSEPDSAISFQGAFLLSVASKFPHLFEGKRWEPAHLSVVAHILISQPS